MQANDSASPVQWSRYACTLRCGVPSAMFPTSHLFRSLITGVVALSLAGPGMCSRVLTAECSAGQTASVKKPCCCGEKCDCGPACRGDSTAPRNQPLPATSTRDVRDLVTINASHDTFAFKTELVAFSSATDSFEFIVGAGQKTLLAQHTSLRV
jgi:hypothetical protein